MCVLTSSICGVRVDIMYRCVCVFVKNKTAYEVRISDWSADVCSSDLRNWVMIPHVTNNDAADITELEELRQTLNQENQKSGVKVTMLAFLIKAYRKSTTSELQ